MLANGADKRDVTEKSMKVFLGVSSGKGDAWKKGQWPSADDLDTIAARLGFSYRWLVTGEGDPEGDDAPAFMVEQPQAVPDSAMDEAVALRAECAILKDKLIVALEDNKLLHERLAQISGDREKE